MTFKEITLADASTEAKVETLGIVLDKELESLYNVVNSVEAMKGDKGDKGEQGVLGRDGKDGKDGIAGRDGKDGKDGVDGKDGEDGLEAPKIIDAEVAIDDTLLLTLSDGSEIKTTKTIVGPKGPGGMNGAQGPMGLQGPQGIQGVKGDTGDIGSQGLKGDKGDTGDTGATGTTGTAGTTGTNGTNGVGVPVGGTTGQVLSKINTTDYNTQWVTPSSGGVSSFNTRTGAVTLTSSDVTTALTFTPYNATNPNGYTSNLGTVTSVTGTAPVVSSGGTTPAISMAQATSLVSGYLSSTDWNTFNNKTSNTGTVTSVGGTGTVSGLTLTGTVTSTGNLTLGGTLSATASNISDFSTAADARIGAASIHALSDVIITSPANTQVLTYNGTNWVNAAAPTGGGGGSITSTEASLSTDVQMPTSNTWYDGPSVSLAAGTWLVSTHTTFARTATTALTYYNRITDGTNHHASSSVYMASVANHSANVGLTAVFTLASTTTIKIQSTTNAGATSALMKAALLANGSGNNATQITAIKLA